MIRMIVVLPLTTWLLTACSIDGHGPTAPSAKSVELQAAADLCETPSLFLVGTWVGTHLRNAYLLDIRDTRKIQTADTLRITLIPEPHPEPGVTYYRYELSEHWATASEEDLDLVEHDGRQVYYRQGKMGVFSAQDGTWAFHYTYEGFVGLDGVKKTTRYWDRELLLFDGHLVLDRWRFDNIEFAVVSREYQRVDP